MQGNDTQGYKVWSDPVTNRLHLLIKRALSQAEIQTARWRLLQATEILQPGFSVNILQDLEQEQTATQASHGNSIARINRDLNHILSALYESAA